MSKDTSSTAWTLFLFMRLAKTPASTGNSLVRCSTWSSGSPVLLVSVMNYSPPLALLVREVAGAFFSMKPGSVAKWHLV